MSSYATLMLEKAEEGLSPLVTGLCMSIVMDCDVPKLGAMLNEIRDLIDSAKHHHLALVKKSSIFTQGEIKQLFDLLAPLCGKGSVEAVNILKKALNEHKIPHEL